MLDVIIDGVKYVPAASANKDELGFAVGDFVKLVRPDILGLEVGDYGKVLYIAPDGALGVEFAKPFKEGHNLAGLTAWGHGHWFDPTSPSVSVVRVLSLSAN